MLEVRVLGVCFGGQDHHRRMLARFGGARSIVTGSPPKHLPPTRRRRKKPAAAPAAGRRARPQDRRFDERRPPADPAGTWASKAGRLATVDIHEAQTKLARLSARLEAGEDVVIARDGEPVARRQHWAQRGGGLENHEEVHSRQVALCRTGCGRCGHATRCSGLYALADPPCPYGAGGPPSRSASRSARSCPDRAGADRGTDARLERRAVRRRRRPPPLVTPPPSPPRFSLTVQAVAGMS